MPDFVTIEQLSYGKRPRYTRPITAKEARLVEGPNIDHRVKDCSDPDKWGQVIFTCACGFTLNITPTTNGGLKKAGQRRWDNHLVDAESTPQTRIDLGTIQRQKKPIQTLFVAPTKYFDADKFKPKPRGREGWACFMEADDSNVILGFTKTREEAITVGLKTLDTAERRGSGVVRESVGDQVPRPESVKSTMGGLLAAEVKDMNDLNDAIDAIDEVLLLVPLLEQRKRTLLSQRSEMLFSLVGSVDVQDEELSRM